MCNRNRARLVLALLVSLSPAAVACVRPAPVAPVAPRAPSRPIVDDAGHPIYTDPGW